MPRNRSDDPSQTTDTGSADGSPSGSPADAAPADRLDLERLALSRSALDRVGDLRRDPAWWTDTLADPRTRFLPVARGRFPVDDDGTGPRLRWSAAPAGAGELVLLGVDATGRAHVAVQTEEPGSDWVSLRDVGGSLGDLDAGAATHASALLAWHAAEGFSPASGRPTSPAHAGAVRVDETGRELYPRTDPAMIVLVHDGPLHDPASRALLGHQRVWPDGRFSCLAGFVEAGESLEQSVAREVAEESGVSVDTIRYAGSQPWPFPRSLMVGFTARATSTELRPDGEEIAEVRWFTREQLRDDVDAGRVLLPGRVSIARRLIEGWYGAELPGDW